MPLGFDPADTVLCHLDPIDKGKPDAERVKFEIRFLTCTQSKQVSRLRKQAWDALCASNEAKANDLLNQAIRMGIVGWKGLKDSAGRDVAFEPPPATPPAPPVLKDADGNIIPQEEPESPPDVLDDFSMRMKLAIVDEYPFQLLLSSTEKKASPLPSPVDTAGPAKAAPAEPAKTSPA